MEINLKNFPDWDKFEEPLEFVEAVQNWANNFELELKAKLVEYKPKKKASTKETWARAWCRLLITEILGE